VLRAKGLLVASYMAPNASTAQGLHGLHDIGAHLNGVKCVQSCRNECSAIPLRQFRFQSFYEARRRLQDLGFGFKYVVEDSFDLRLVFQIED